MTRRKIALRIGLLAVGLLGCVLALPACAAAVPLVSAGASAGEAGYSFWNSGRLTYVDEGTPEQMNRAMDLTLERLALIVHDTSDRMGEDGQLVRRWWSIRSDLGHLVTIEVRPLTGAMVEVRINAGAFGNRAAAELIASRLKVELDELQAAEE